MRHLRKDQLFLLSYISKIAGLQYLQGNYIGNNIDRQVFGIPFNLIFLLLLSAFAFGGVGLQLGVGETISDLISKLLIKCLFFTQQPYITL